MIVLADWAQRIVTFRPLAANLVELAWPYKVHMVLGMTIFLLFPFSRLVHVWSGFATVAYLGRPYQVVRSRRLGITPRDAATISGMTHRPLLPGWAWLLLIAGLALAGWLAEGRGWSRRAG